MKLNLYQILLKKGHLFAVLIILNLYYDHLTLDLYGKKGIH